jgi:predicted O-methyltransferase YrrM
MNLAQIDKKTWRRLAVFVSLVSGGCAGWLAWGGSEGQWLLIVPAGILGAIIAGPLVALLGSVNLKLNDLRTNIRRDHLSLRELTNIRPLLDGPPLDYGHWAIDPCLAKILAQLIYQYQPDHILECGSGTSTAFMAKLLKRVNPEGRVTALEHLPEYAQETDQLLRNHAVETMAEVLRTPLRAWEVEDTSRSWYGVDPDRLPENSIDLLVVDGPPHTTGDNPRYAAVFVLEKCLSDQCVIVLDDGKREEEKKAAKRWAEVLDADVEYKEGPKGTYILRRG